MWNRLKSAMQKNLAVTINYAEVERLLDVDNFIDYIMLNVYSNTGDWPHNNWRAARERVPLASGNSFLGTQSGHSATTAEMLLVTT